MIHRIAIVAGITAAAAILAISLAAAGIGGSGGSADAGVTTIDQPAAASVDTPRVKTVTDTVYVRPVPTPKVIHVTKPAPARASAPKPIVIVKHVASHTSGGEPGDGSEPGDGNGEPEGGD